MKKTILAFFCFINSLYPNQKPVITTTLAPYAYAIEQIAKDRLVVHVLIPEDSNPHLHESKPQDIKKLQESKVWFYSGEDLDKKLFEKVSVKKIDLNEGINLHLVGCCKNHASKDLHTWLSPDNYLIQSKKILKELIETSPENKEFFEQNFIELENKLISLKQEILSKSSKSPIVVAHGAYHYLCQDLNVNQITIEKEGKEASLKDIQTLYLEFKDNSPKKIFAQIQHSPSGAKRLAELTGSKVVMVNPYQKNYPAAIQEILKEIP
jgi:zinc transport system substrate-binding protein